VQSNLTAELTPGGSLPDRAESHRAPVATLIDLVAQRGAELGDELAFVFLGDGETEEARLTFAGLARRAQAIGCALQERGLAGERALLLYASGTDFIEAYFGCLYAGVVAVPVYPPRDTRTAGGLQQLEAIVADAAPATLLTTSSLLPLFDALPAVQSLARLGSDAVPDEAADGWRPPTCSLDSLAMLQYTSGSTGDPKGVMLSHGNVLANQQILDELSHEPEPAVAVSWLPLYHDMGLFGTVVHPVYVGRPSVIMSTIAFLQRPLRWLRAISDWHATTSGGPNFAYELCVKKITPAERDTLDLSSWQIAFTGAEPVRSETLQRFSEFFAPAGFRFGSFSPCYGLAEATVGVSLTPSDQAPQIVGVSSQELERGHASTGDMMHDRRTLVGSGPTAPGHRVVVVDPETLCPAEPGDIGEIWVAGPSVAAGYWRRAADTERTFQAHLSGSEDGPFLRTGDLGFIADGGLVITGRAKDLLILRGRNIYPQDIERTVEQSHSALRRGRVAAFGVDVDGEERLAVVHEVDPSKLDDPTLALDAIAEALGEEHGIRAERIVLVAPGEVMKTSSGKIRRRDCRARLESCELRVVAERSANAQAAEAEIAELAAEVLGCPPGQLDRSRPLTALGIDSLHAVQLQDRIASELGLQVSIADLLGGNTLAQIAGLAQDIRGDQHPEARGFEAQAAAGKQMDFPLGELQQAYCAGRLPNFELGGVGGHIYVEFSSDRLDPERLQDAWRQLIDRHDALRTVISTEGVQRIRDRKSDWSLPVEDLRGLPAEAVDQRIAEVRNRMSHQVFEVGQWPMFEMQAHRLDGGRLHLHFSIDLLVVDAASAVLLIQEWERLYDDPDVELPAATGLREVVEQQIHARGSHAYRRSLEYWRERLRDIAGPPRLPLAASPSSITSPRFSRRASTLPQELWQNFKARAAGAGLTPSAALLAVYAEVLAAWSESPRFTVNVTMLTGPSVAEKSVAVGPYASFNLIEIDSTPGGSFEERAQRLQQRLWEALDHHQIGGVRALRELTRLQSLSRTAAKMPVVFTPVLRELSVFAWLGEQVCGISQTPQVSLDNQAFLFQGGLMFHWDAVDDVFPDGVLDDMFAAYCHLLEKLAADEGAWSERATDDSLPGHQPPPRQAEDAGEAAIPNKRVEQLFAERAEKAPESAAVLTHTGCLTYGELNNQAARVACWLQGRGVGRGDVVGALSESAQEQVLFALAIAMSGATYLPLAPELTTPRLAGLLQEGGVQYVLCDRTQAQRDDRPEAVEFVSPDEIESESASAPKPTDATTDDIAFTYLPPGVTDFPKGIPVSHRALVNAITYTNESTGVGHDDRVLEIGALDAERSIFHVFAALAAGAAIVVAPPTQRTDPAACIDLMARHGVTACVGDLVSTRALIDHRETTGAQIPASLRAVLVLAREQLPAGLPSRIRASAPRALVVTLAGSQATPLWPLHYQLDSGDGHTARTVRVTPIANTRCYVIDEFGRERPVWVAGEICCAGLAVSAADGQDANSAAQRLVHPRSGEMLYRLGHRGRRLPDGSIEVLDRNDHRGRDGTLKPGLKTVEAAVSRHPAVRSCVVVAGDHADGSHELVAHVIPVEPAMASSVAVLSYLNEQLPAHLVPARINWVHGFAATPNGEPHQADADGTPHSQERAQAPADSAAIVKTVTGIVEQVLGQASIPSDQDLEDLGVGSIDMIRIANLLEEEFGFRPDADELFTVSTIEDVARFYAGQTTPGPNSRRDGASGEAAPASAQAMRAYRVLADADERTAFRERSEGLRRDLRATAVTVALDASEGPPALRLERHSSRSFSPVPAPQQSLSGLLSVLRSLNGSEGRPHYAFASAGGAYSVQTYLHIKANGFTDIPEGTYYYHPTEHKLVRLAADATGITRDLHWWSNRAIFDDASFSIFLIAQLDAVGPLYGERSLHFATLEAGLMAQLLEMAAANAGLGLCQTGDLDFAPIKKLFALDDSHVLVHSLMGGPIEHDTTVSDPGRRQQAVLHGNGSSAPATPQQGDPLTQPGSSVGTSLLQARAALDADIQGPRGAVYDTPQSRALLTGATGFLGIFLLSELVTRHDCSVTCLVRASDAAAAQRRLQRTADRFGISWDTLADRVTAIAGDVSQPEFGLSEQQYADLAAGIDCIYHSAASVNWIHPYCALEAGTVDGARHILRFAVHDTTKAVHYVSSLAVFPFNGKIMREAHNLDYDDTLLGGYAQTKWVAERLMAEAASRGVPIAIYRPPLISGHARTGVFNRNSYFENMVRGCVEMKQVPRLDGVVDVAPVDYVASALAHLSRQTASLGKVFHLNNPRPLEFHLFTDWMRERGHRLEALEFAEWKNNLIESPAHKRNALYPFTQHLRAASAADMTIPPHDCTIALERLVDSGIICPPVGDALLGVYFDFFEACGFLYPAPGLALVTSPPIGGEQSRRGVARRPQPAPAIG
jgi:thioester reductase-like protein